MFVSIYLSLYCAFILGIYTLNRSYHRYFAAVATSPGLSPDEVVGCNSTIMLSDIQYQLFTVSFGDGLMSALSPGRQNDGNYCGGIMVLTRRRGCPCFKLGD